MNLEWKTEKRKVNDVLPYAHNPRKISALQMKNLQDSLAKFGLVEIPAINLDNTLIAGHQRCNAMQMLGKGDEMIDVRVPNRLLTEAELKEYNVASNAIKGDWLEEVLKEHFTEVNTEAYGIQFEQYDKLLSEAKPKEESPEFPIVAKMGEQYNALVIVCSNEIDFNFLIDVLELGKERSYKSEAIGQTRVMTAEKFTNIWNRKLSYQATSELEK